MDTIHPRRRTVAADSTSAIRWSNVLCRSLQLVRSVLSLCPCLLQPQDRLLHISDCHDILSAREREALREEHNPERERARTHRLLFAPTCVLGSPSSLYLSPPCFTDGRPLIPQSTSFITTHRRIWEPFRLSWRSRGPPPPRRLFRRAQPQRQQARRACARRRVSTRARRLRAPQPRNRPLQRPPRGHRARSPSSMARDNWPGSPRGPGRESHQTLAQSRGKRAPLRA
mmetsp:Transcript_5760/g.19641  ORF Transcript_5760/g.19641 Transcript_5760/m.19641 type:complete len:228 (+) Transcript_5760:228-911(+)